MWQHFFSVSHPLGPLCLFSAADAVGSALTCWQCHFKCLCFSAVLTQSCFPGSWLWSAKVWELMVLGATLTQPVRFWSWWITIPVFLPSLLFVLGFCFRFRFLVFCCCLLVGWFTEILTGIKDSHRRLGSKGIECQTKETGLDSVVDRECCGLI